MSLKHEPSSGPASERRGHTFKGVKDVCLKAKAVTVSYVPSLALPALYVPSSLDKDQHQWRALERVAGYMAQCMWAAMSKGS